MARGRPLGKTSTWWKFKRRIICELYEPRDEDVKSLYDLRIKLNKEAKERAKKC